MRKTSLDLLSRRKTFSLALLLLLATAIALPVAAGEQPEKEVLQLQEKIQAKLEELRETAGFPGMTVGFVLSDGRAGAVATGAADLEQQIPMTPGHRMFAGSVGKTYASAVMLQLVQEGKAGLDTKISHWFGAEDWFARLPNSGDLTLRMLMSHTTGIPEHVMRPDFLKAVGEQPDKIWEGKELVTYILGQEPMFAAGEKFAYADTNYILVGMIIERITGNDYYAELQKRILEPLHLTATVPQIHRTTENLASGYTGMGDLFGFPKKVSEGGRYAVNPQFEWTGGGIITNTEELARWAKDLYEGKVLDAATMKALLTPMGGSRRIGGEYGLGVQLRESEWGITFGHSGFFPGYITDVQYFPQLKIAVAVQFNTDKGRELQQPPRAYVAEIVRIITGDSKP